MQSQQSQNTLIAGCQYITDSVKKGILGNFFEQILLEGIHTLNSSCFGTKPSRFPSPNITPVHVACNAAAVLEAIEGLPLTWVEINSLSNNLRKRASGRLHGLASRRNGQLEIGRRAGETHRTWRTTAVLPCDARPRKRGSSRSLGEERVDSQGSR